jgi:hypothetical protein
MHSYKSCVTILQSYIKIDRAVSEELRSQDFLIVHYSEKCPITPTKYVESKWRYSMHIYTSCVTILQSFIKVGQAFLEEMCSQSYSDGRTDGRTQTITMSLRRFAAGDKKGIRVEYIRLFKPEITRVQTYGWATLGQTDLRTNGPSD